MKALIIFTLLLVGSTLWGFDNYMTSKYENQTWSEIEADSSKLVAWPTIMGLPINKICVTKDKIKALEPVKSCKEWRLSSQKDCRKKTDWCFTQDEMGYGEASSFKTLYYKCTMPSINEKFQISRYITVNNCVETKADYSNNSDADNFSCTRIKSEKMLYPQTQSVTITDYRTEASTWGTKAFTIPDCK